MTVGSGQSDWTAINVRYSSFEMSSTKLAFMFPTSLTFAFHFVNLNF